jgi:NAD(P)H-flavin reductase
MREETAQAGNAIADPMLTHPVTIRRIAWENDDTFTLTLDTSGLNGGLEFLPGQFNMLYVFGVGESAISISSDPARKSTLDHTIHRVGTVTTVLAQLKRGDVIGIRGPYGSSWPVSAAEGKDVCIVSGGIGLAPLRPVIYSMVRRRQHYRRIIVAGVETLVTVDRGDSSWKGHIGVVTSLFNYIKLDARDTVAYVCGPEIMMKFSVDELERRGVPTEQVYVSMERNMKCAVGFCGHCQMGPTFICKDGPVYPLGRVRHLMDMKEL